MADLKFIMDVEDDQPGPPPSRQGHDLEPYSSSSTTSLGTTAAFGSRIPSQAYVSHVSNPSPQRQDTGLTSSSVRSIAPAPVNLATTPSGSRGLRASSNRTTTSKRHSSRRQSTASNDSMDQTGYGSAASSSSRGGGLHSSNSPFRPMSGPTPSDPPPIKYTPITRRVSRAKKGVAVHTCEICQPPKIFTRAEHLRRHQLSHQTPGYPCTYPGCDRAFHRSDLLIRHQAKHEHEDGQPGGKGEGYNEEEGQRRQPAFGNPTYHHGFASQPTSSSGLSLDPGLSAMGQGSAPPSVTPSTPTPTAPYQQPRGQADTTISSHPPRSLAGGGGSTEYTASSRPPYSSHCPPRPSCSVISPSVTVPSVSTGATSYPGFPNEIDVFQQPRRSPPSVFVTQGLSLPSLSIPDSNLIPELYHHGTDASPWASSASDSTFSTPASAHARNPRSWLGRHLSPTSTDWSSNNLLSPFPNLVASSDTHSASRENRESMPAPPSAMSTSPFTPTQCVTSTGQARGYGRLLDVPLTGLESIEVGSHDPTSPTSGGHHQQHHFTGGNLATTASSEGSGGTLVTPVMSLPTRLSPLETLGHQKDIYQDGPDPNQWNVDFDLLGGVGGGFGDMDPGSGTGTGLLMALDLPMTGPGCGMPTVVAQSMQLPRTTRAAIPGYIETYWKRFHSQYPIVHRPSFDRSPDQTVLPYAMAAVGTQYLPTKEDRVRGDQLHEYAWQELKRIAQWNLQHMQAILLCELYVRFRGRKAVTRPSTMFESLCSRVSFPADPMFHPSAPSKEQQAQAEGKWYAWIEAETKRRLLTACFIIDFQTSAYQQQQRAIDSTAVTSALRLTGPGARLWGASSAAQWASILASDPEAANPASLPGPDGLTPEDIQARPRFDQTVILATELLRLPRVPNPTSNNTSHPTINAMDLDPHPAFTSPSTPSRIQHLFPASPTAATYLALHHTPLHDLLAVSGDTFIFMHKVLPATTFLAHQRRLKAWATGPSAAAQATLHAARAILLFLERKAKSPAAAPWMEDLADYWALYVCALVIWAFGHHRVQHARHKRGGDAGREEMAEEATLGWLRNVSSMAPEEVVRVRARREAGGVVGLVRRRLEGDCVGGRSRLYADAVRVLRKLEDGGSWNWF